MRTGGSRFRSGTPDALVILDGAERVACRRRDVVISRKRYDIWSEMFEQAHRKVASWRSVAAGTLRDVANCLTCWQNIESFRDILSMSATVLPVPWDPLTPYVDLPDLPPSAELESKAVLKTLVEARVALARLDQATLLIPNPTVLLNTIPLLEAQASSEIENIVTTADDLFRYAQDEGAASDPATKETLRYRTALYTGVQDVRSRALTVNTAARVCSVIKQREMGVRQLPGTRIANPVTEEVIYAPPEGHSVLIAKLSNWERFVHAVDGLDPLVRMAVSHYQFEAIHPFDDGNGRTGRIINILMLIEAELISQPVIYLSRYIIKTKTDYYRLLLEVTATGSWEPWVLYMLTGVRSTAESAIRKITAIRDLQYDVTERMKSVSGVGRNADFRNVLFEQPYVRIQTVMARCGVSRPTATSWLNSLVNLGILRDLKLGRDRLFVNPRFLDLLLREEP